MNNVHDTFDDKVGVGWLDAAIYALNYLIGVLIPPMQTIHLKIDGFQKHVVLFAKQAIRGTCLLFEGYEARYPENDCCMIFGIDVDISPK